MAPANPEPSAAPREERVLVLAPTGRDAEMAQLVLNAAGFATATCDSIAALCGGIRAGAGAVLLAEEALCPTAVEALRAVLRAEEPWSDLPIVLLTGNDDHDEARRRILDLLDSMGNITILERPVRKLTLITALGAALRARRRQYQARDLMEQLRGQGRVIDCERRRLRAVLDACPLGIFLTNASGRLVEFNPAAERIWGGLALVESPAEYDVYRAWWAGTGRRVEAHEWGLARAIENGEECVGEEVEILGFDGARRTVLNSAYPIRLADGQLVGAVALNVDITERARAEQAQRVLAEASERLARSLDPEVTLRTLAQIVVQRFADCCTIDEIDDAGIFHRLTVEVSGPARCDAAARLLAFAPTPSADSLAARVLETQRPMLISEISPAWLDAKAHDADHRAALAELAPRSLLMVPLIARDRPLGLLGMVSTAPDRRYDARDAALMEELGRRAALALDNARLHREAQRALRTRDALIAELDAFLANSPVGFAVFDRALRFTRVNDVLAALHGRAADEHLGRTLTEIVPPAIEAQVGGLVRRVVATGERLVGREVVAELPAGSGQIRHFLASVVPLRDVSGRPDGAGVIVTEVTHLKQAEQELRRDAALRERFIGVLAHDLRNPLHAIAFTASMLLKQSDLPFNWLRSVGRIAQAADRMARMVGDLLDVVRSRQGGGMPIARAPSDLACIVRQVVEELEAAHPDRQIALTTQGNTHGEIDADRVAQVASNLVANALAYSPADTAVRVETRGEEASLVLAVSNRGAPIPPAEMGTLFEPFKRGNPEQRRTAQGLQGLGLGLFVTQEIVNAHGGAIRVTSTAEAGTTFEVRLPRGGR